MNKDFKSFINDIRKILEDKLKKELSKRTFIERMFFSAFMPLRINILTNKGNFSLIVQKDSSITTQEKLQNPDITIQADFETLVDLFTKKNKEEFIKAEKEEKIKIISNTPKGKQAESYLRKMFS